MWKSGTVALLTVVVVGCATPEQVQAPAQVEAPEQVQAPAQVQAPEQRQAREQRQRREQRQKRIAAEQERIAADHERIAAHLQRDLGPVCTSAGLTPGTDAHSRCMDSLYRLELERRAANRLLPR
jgi:hypothetical protein